jgi:hypothetical protein
MFHSTGQRLAHRESTSRAGDDASIFDSERMAPRIRTRGVAHVGVPSPHRRASVRLPFSRPSANWARPSQRRGTLLDVLSHRSSRCDGGLIGQGGRLFLTLTLVMGSITTALALTACTKNERRAWRARPRRLQHLLGGGSNEGRLGCSVRWGARRGRVSPTQFVYGNDDVPP